MGLIFLVTCLETVGAQDLMTVDFPISSAPVQFSDHLAAPPRQVTGPDDIGYAEFSLLPIPADRNLLITVIFREGGHGPSLFWTNESSSERLSISDDLAEGLEGINQRTILVPREVAVLPGKLILQGEQSRIFRVRMDWAPLRRVFAATDQKPIAFLMGDRLLEDTELTGGRTLSPPDIWFGKVLEASLQDEPATLSENVGFAFDLDQPVEQGLFSVKVMGLPLDKTVEVWINDTPMGQLHPAVPALTDAGYLRNESGKTVYAGWRSGSLHIPGDILIVGENCVVLVAAGEKIFIRDAAIQMSIAQEENPVAIPGPTPLQALEAIPAGQP